MILLGANRDSQVAPSTYVQCSIHYCKQMAVLAICNNMMRIFTHLLARCHDPARGRLTSKRGTAVLANLIVHWVILLQLRLLQLNGFSCHLQYHHSPANLDAPVNSEDSATLGDLVEDKHVESAEDDAEASLMHNDMNQLLYTLSPRESQVVRLRYGLDDGQEKTLEEVGKIMLVSLLSRLLHSEGCPSHLPGLL